MAVQWIVYGVTSRVELVIRLSLPAISSPRALGHDAGEEKDTKDRGKQKGEHINEIKYRATEIMHFGITEVNIHTIITFICHCEATATSFIW